MKAKDTVMSQDTLNDIFYGRRADGTRFPKKASVTLNLPEQLPYLEEQAEISWKAGREAERAFILQNTDRDIRARKEGIRKVVEEATPIVDKLFEALSHADFPNDVEVFGIDEGRVRAAEFIKDIEEQWQAKLKEWGRGSDKER